MILLRLMTLAGRMLQTSLTHFYLKICVSQPHKKLQAIKLLRLARSRRNFPIYKRNQPDESLKESLWSELLYIGHMVDLELTLPLLLGPVPWSLLTTDRIPTKTDKSKLPHGLQSHIEPTLD